MSKYLCICNNCGEIMWDKNPDEQTVINVENFDFSNLKKPFLSQSEDEDDCPICPTCHKDDFFCDIYPHNLAKRLYDNGYCKTSNGFPVKTYTGSEPLSDFPNFDSSGSIYGMKKKFYGFHALLVRKNGYVYNVTRQPHFYFIHAK